MEISKELFEEFWNSNGKYFDLNNKDRTYKNLLKAVSECPTSEELDFKVSCSKTKKETVRKIVVAFYDYVAEKKDCSYESPLTEKRYYDYPIERQLEIAKYLHEPHTRQEIMDKFEIGEKTFANDLATLEAGINVAGSDISIKKETIRKSKGKNGKCMQYSTTIHPIFLPLNLTEVYSLILCLDKMVDDKNPNAAILRHISGRIKAQLSSYAISRLSSLNVEQNGPYDNTYVDDKDFALNKKNVLIYLLKAEKEFRFFCNDEEHKGKVIFDEDCKFYILSDDGKKINPETENICFNVDEVKYD